MKIITANFVMAFIAGIQILPAQNKSISGFSDKETGNQFQLESRFDTLLSNEHIGQTIKELSAYPHHLGSPGDKAVAESILNKFKSYGWDAKIETYHVLYPTPKIRVLELTSPTNYKALLEEPAIKEDVTSGLPGQLPLIMPGGLTEMSLVN